MSEDQTFWGRRRASVAAEARAEQAEQDDLALAQAHEALEDKTDAEILAEFSLPDPDTMKQGDDFTAFMAKAVPDHIRRRALRTLWRSNPVLANVDMLVDYGEDFTDAAMAVENIQTAYQVGKGMLKHIEEMARQAEAAENPVALEEIEENEEIDVQPDEEVLLGAVDEVGTLHTDEDMEFAEEDFSAPTPRRMRFRIEETA